MTRAPDFIFDSAIGADEKAAFCKGWLSAFQKLNLPKLRESQFSESRWADRVTLLFHSFWPDGSFNEFPILHSWKLLGRLPTVVVTDRETPSMAAFKERYGDTVKVKLSYYLKRGDVNSLSRDCLNNMYRHFDTEYCLVVQDDGFPIRDNLDEFLGKWDYVGAPFVRDLPQQYLADLLLKNCLNGGFSLRSRRYCEAVCEEWKKWGKEYQKKNGWNEEEDWFYSAHSRRKLSHRLKYRLPWASQARKFSAMDILGVVDLRKYRHVPFGVHSPTTCYFYQEKLHELGYELPREQDVS